MATQDTAALLNKEDAEKMTADQLFKRLDSSAENGLSDQEAARRLEHYGPNVLEERGSAPY